MQLGTFYYFRVQGTYSITVLDGKSRGTCFIPVQFTLIRVWPKRTQVHLPGWTSSKQHKPNVINQPTNMTHVRITTSLIGWATTVFPICWEKAWRHFLNFVLVQVSSFTIKCYFSWKAEHKSEISFNKKGVCSDGRGRIFQVGRYHSKHN